MAGPIVRYRDVAGQLSEPRPSRSDLARGVERFIVGLAKKVLIADTVPLFWLPTYTILPSGLTATE